MTNKERLDNLTEKVNELTETLNNKILALDTGTRIIEVELPEEIASNPLNTIFNFVIDDVVLISTDKTSGIWEVDTKLKTITKIYNDGKHWKNFRFS